MGFLEFLKEKSKVACLAYINWVSVPSVGVVEECVMSWVGEWYKQAQLQNNLEFIFQILTDNSQSHSFVCKG